MKLLALPRGKQNGIKGAVVNVPVEAKVVCDSLTMTISQAGIIPLKLKRKCSKRDTTSSSMLGQTKSRKLFTG